MPAVRDSRISFPDAHDTIRAADKAGDGRDAGEKTAESSHVARRRGPSSPRHEFSVDEFLELSDDAPDVELVPTASRVSRVSYPVAAPTPAPPPASEPPASEPPRSRPRSLPPPLPSSIAPVSADAFPETAPFNVPTMASAPPPRARARSRSPWPLAMAILAAGAVAAALVLRMAPAASTSAPAAMAPSYAAGPVAAPPVAATGTPPAMPAPPATPSAASETARSESAGDAPALIGPQAPPVGTVIGAEGHRLWVDGHLMPSWRADVDCGEHLVQVGSAGTPRSVDVRCDSEVIVSP